MNITLSFIQLPGAIRAEAKSMCGIELPANRSSVDRCPISQVGDL